MIDDGVNGNPTPASGVKVPAQLQALGVTHVDHHFASHYHADHIGLFATIFGSGGVATLGYGWDRAESYTTQTYTNYVNTLGPRRRTLVKGQVITLDSLSAHPVLITCVDLNGAGTNTTDENGQSLVLRVSYGEFDAVFGGDLPGTSPAIEPIVGPEVGPVEVYKVNHHGSASSTTTNWLTATTPKVAVISCGTGNTYGHPTASVLSRLHAAGVKSYWTETGSGVAPNPAWDKVSNNQVIISATWQPGGVDTIRGTGFADTFINSGTSDVTPPVVAVAAPDGGETWTVGSSQNITWNATDGTGVTSVTLTYSTSGASGPYNTIATGEANDGVYAWTVPNAPSRDAYVKVTAFDAATNSGTDFSSGAFTIADSSVVTSVGEDIPIRAQLAQNYPNPFGGTTTFSFSLSEASDARLEVYDLNGRRMATVVDMQMGPGSHQVRWSPQASASEMASGIYFYRLTLNGTTRLTRRMVLMQP